MIIAFVGGPVLTDEQKIAFGKAIKAYSEIYEQFSDIFSKIVEDKIKPLIEDIYELVKDYPKPKIKYRLVKIIRPVQYFRINKPKLIHCRNNC